MKKMINTPESVVNEMCLGMIKAHPELDYDSHYKIIKKKAINKNKVTLISGGGSGHEPAHAGFVGKGMLDAAVCGDVFASPSQTQVFNAIKQTRSDKGTLLIIKNYSGDLMNFNNAAGTAKDFLKEIMIDSVFVNDDIAVKDSLYTVGRRGVAGTVFVHKVAGAMAEMGFSLREVKDTALKAVLNVRSIGFALTSCTVPAKGSPTFSLEKNMMEYGVGIHGEPGKQREKILSADELADKITNEIIDDLKLILGDEVALLINGFGGTPLQELYVLNNSVWNTLERKKIKIYRNYVGNFVTSLDMAGASVSIMKLDDELKQCLDYPVYTPALKLAAVGKIKKVEEKLETSSQEENVENKKVVYTNDEKPYWGDKFFNTSALIALVRKMADIIIANEKHFCDMDSAAGDGDFGMSISKGFAKLKEFWENIKKDNVGEFLDAAGEIIMEYCGGASGPIWGSAFRAAGKAADSKTKLTIKDMADMLDAAVKAVQTTGERSFGRGAVIGDKTLIDALVPCANAWKDAALKGIDIKTAFKLGAEAAKQGSDSTKNIVARMGRAGVVGDRSLGHPDAGAYGLAVIFHELYIFVNSMF